MKVISSPNAPAAIGPYSQAMVANGFLFASGQTGLTPDGSAPAETLEGQAVQAMENLKAVLEAAGLGFEDVVKTTCFLADINDFAAFNAIYEKYFVSKPARSCFAVKTLPKNLLCEIELIAACK